MEVAFVSQPWERVAVPDLGSIEILTLATATRLADHCRVRIYARNGGHTKPVETRDGVQYFRFPVLHEDRLLAPFERVLFPRPSSPLVASRVYGAAYIHQIARHLAARRCDIVHIHNFSQFIPVIRRFNPKIRIVLHMHCDWLTQFDRSLLEPRLRAADAIVGCSHHMTGRIQARFPEFAGKCHMISNGVDVNCFKPPAGASAPQQSRANGTRILFVGRVSPEKGVHVLLESFRHIAERFPDAELNIVGADSIATAFLCFDLSDDAVTRDLSVLGASDYPRFVRRLIPQAIRHRVKFTGFVPHTGLPAVYNSHHVVVSTSICHEAFCVPVTEAMASALPVIGTCSGGVAEQIDNGKTGILIGRNSVPALTAALAQLISDAGLRSSMGEAGRKRAVEMFSWTSNIPKWLNLYATLC
jgi:spore coat protein SA